MSDKKKVLGKGKPKPKEQPFIKKLELPKYSNDSLTSDEFSLKKFKSPKLTSGSNNSETGKKCATPTPLSTAKRRFFNKRTSESSKLSKEEYESKRKSMPNIQEGSEGYDLYVRKLGAKLAKYKQKNFELEEEIKSMESRFKLEETSLRGEIDRVNAEMKKIKNEHQEQETNLHEEILRLRRENEETKFGLKFHLSQVPEMLESHLDKTGKEKLEVFLADILWKNEENLEVSPAPANVPSNYTASFSNLPNEVNSSREVVKPAQTQAIVMHDYSPTSHGELKLKSGDTVTILNADEHNAWWLGRIGDKIGMFPRNCVMLD